MQNGISGCAEMRISKTNWLSSVQISRPLQRDPVIKGHKITQQTTASIIFSQCFHSDRELSINVIYESRPMKINAREEKSAQCKSAIKINICSGGALGSVRLARAHAPINRLFALREINIHVCEGVCALMGEQTSGKQMHARKHISGCSCLTFSLRSIHLRSIPCNGL
jgi:hypothetical protein